ncbi:MAG: AAA family ATPase [Bacteroidales bacterium]|nr:AAA family ATPase [Bacteroidales bacterium]
MYLPRIIDKYLKDWAENEDHKPLMLRGARQVGKSWTVEHLGEDFKNFIKIDFEKNPEYISIFKGNRDVKRIVSQLSVTTNSPIVGGDTLLFLDEIQECPEAIMALRYFREDMPELHVIAAGSLLEFALDELPTFGVSRIHSMFMYPMTFDEFLWATSNQPLYDARRQCNSTNPLPEVLYQKIMELFRTYIIVGGMPEVVSKWISTHDYIKCQTLQDDIIIGYEADFPKYRKKVNPELLRNTLRSAALQVTKKFVYSQVRPGWKTEEVKKSLDLLYKAGILKPVTRTDANGLPLGVEADFSYRKVLVMDSGLLLRLQNMELDNSAQTSLAILTASAADLVNKGPLAEMIAGLEIDRYMTPNLRHDLYYWVKMTRNSTAEVDYVLPMNGKVMPVEVKADQRGGMKSLWEFMRAKGLTQAIRSSLENFGEFDYTDAQADGALRHVTICPLYALSQLTQSIL